MKFFLFGSLDLGRIHHGLVSSHIISCEDAKIRGRAYRLEVGYPVLSEEALDEVEGTLVELKGSEVLKRILDEFHGYSIQNIDKSLNHRKSVKVRLNNGDEAECEAYFVNPLKLPKTAVSIPFGKWRDNLSKNPPRPETLTDCQKTYVLKLGSATGRDIVPIDLDLYRELLKEGLIVDKGRRLALSRLGRDVYKYLK